MNEVSVMVKSKLWKNLREKHYVHLSRFVRCAASAQVIGVDVVRIRRFGKVLRNASWPRKLAFGLISGRIIRRILRRILVESYHGHDRK